MTPIDSYREQVRSAIARRTGEPILNGSVDHATVIIQEAFNNAKHSVQILTSRLDPDCYARQVVRDAAKYFFLDDSHTASILIEAVDQNIKWDNHPFINDLKPHIASGKLNIRMVPKQWSDSYQYNFLLLDDYGYRFEADRNGTAATAAFFPDGRTDTVKHLGGIFSKIWNASAPLHLQ